MHALASLLRVWWKLSTKGTATRSLLLDGSCGRLGRAATEGDIDLAKGRSEIPRHLTVTSIKATAAAATARTHWGTSAGGGRIRTFQWGGQLESESLEEAVCGDASRYHGGAVLHQCDEVSIVQMGCLER